MAILRDVVTGQGIATGSPAEMVGLADALGHDNVLFDDVGEKFDPDSVRASVQEHVESLREVAEDPVTEDPESAKRIVESASKQADDFEQQLNPHQEKVDEASSALEEARRQAENPV